MHKDSRRYPVGRAKSVGLLMLQALIATAMYGWIVMQSFAIAGCGSTCNYALLGSAYNAYIWVAIGALCVCVISVIAISARGNESWWIPTVGIGVTVLTGAFTLVSIQIATAP